MDDFIYICDDAYKQQHFIAMETKIMSSLGFDINIPIPYRFLRRYAKVRKTYIVIVWCAQNLNCECYSVTLPKVFTEER